MTVVWIIGMVAVAGLLIWIIDRFVWDLWKAIGDNKEQLTIVFTVVAGLTFLYEYTEKISDEKKAQTMAMVSRYSSKEVLDARLRLAAHWLDPKNEAQLTSAKGGAEKNATIVRLIREAKLELDVLQVVNFLGELASCVRSDVCDAKLACEFFYAEATAYRNTYAQLFSDWKQTWGSDFGDALRYLSAQVCPHYAK